MRKKNRSRLLLPSIIPLVIILGGIILYLATGRDTLFRLGVVICASYVALGMAIHWVSGFRQDVSTERYVDAATGAAMGSGLVLLFAYFIWFLFGEMLRLQIFGSVPAPKSSKLTALGGSLVLVGATIGFVPAGTSALKRHLSQSKRGRVVADITILLIGIVLLTYLQYLLIRHLLSLL